jgi:hypothetical protein
VDVVVLKQTKTKELHRSSLAFTGKPVKEVPELGSIIAPPVIEVKDNGELFIALRFNAPAKLIKGEVVAQVTEKEKNAVRDDVADALSVPKHRVHVTVKSVRQMHREAMMKGRSRHATALAKDSADATTPTEQKDGRGELKDEVEFDIKVDSPYVPSDPPTVNPTTGAPTSAAPTSAAPTAKPASYTLRLTGGRTKYDGRVEVLMNGQWGTVCDDKFTPENARVVCHELGLGDPVSFRQIGQLGAHYKINGQTAPIWLDDVKCTGQESSLLQCAFESPHDCKHKEDVTVQCMPTPTRSPTKPGVTWMPTNAPVTRRPTSRPTEPLLNEDGTPKEKSKSSAFWEDTAFIGVSGDPFVIDSSGKKVQFFLPLQHEVHLLTCREMQLYGRAIGTGISGDHQQWFNHFRIAIDGKEQLLLGIEKNATNFGNDEDVDVTTSNITEKQKAFEREHRSLSTIRAIVEGVRLSRTGAVGTGVALVSVWQDKKDRVGDSAAEVVQFSAGNTVMQIKTAVAQKFNSKNEQLLYTHLDLKFIELRRQECTAGILAEIWGTAPMSEETTRMLQPPTDDEQ